MEFGSLEFFLVPLFHFTRCTTDHRGCIKILCCRQFQRVASFEICEIQPLFSEVLFSVFKDGSFRNLYDVNFVVGPDS